MIIPQYIIDTTILIIIQYKIQKTRHPSLANKVHMHMGRWSIQNKHQQMQGKCLEMVQHQPFQLDAPPCWLVWNRQQRGLWRIPTPFGWDARSQPDATILDHEGPRSLPQEQRRNQ